MPVAVTINLSMDELRSFQFYREQTASDLRGLIDNGFWSSTLLLLSHGTEYLEHLIVSLSSLDEAFRLRTLPGQSDLALRRYSFSLNQYQLAIRGLIDDIAQPKDIAVVLASCLVCIAIELWLGDMAKASQHVKAGYNIACGLTQSNTEMALSDATSAALLPSLWRFCTQLGVRVDENFQMFKHSQIRPFSASVESTQSNDARSQFYQLLENYLIEANSMLEGQTIDGAFRYLQHLKSWHDDFISDHKDSKDLREHHLLIVHYHSIRSMLIAVITKDELRYDEYLEDFQQILDHCAMFLQLDGNDQSTVTTRRAPDVAVNMALLLVAWKCRQPQIRRQALRQMYRARRLEGLWSSTMLAILAEQLMALEEADGGQARASNDPATTVPPQCRLVVQTFHYEPGILAADGESADISSWAQNPPTFVIRYGFPDADLHPVHDIRIHMKPYASTSGFGMKSVFWWPMARVNTLLDEEIPEHTRTLDGPHLGFNHLTGRVRPDLRSLLYMRLLELWVAR